MNSAPPPSTERLAFATMVLLTLAAVGVQGLWRALGSALPVEADSMAVTLAALVMVMVVTLFYRLTGGRHPARTALAGLLAAGVAGVLLSPPSGAVIDVSLALAGVALAAAGALPWLLRHLPAEWDGQWRQHKLNTGWMVLLGLATIVLTTRLSVFMGDSTRVDLSLLPEVAFFAQHSCLSAYVEGARLAADGAANLYDIARWPDLDGTPRSTTPSGPYAPFQLDAYAYPPPFLLLPHALLGWWSDFGSQRAVWFVANALFVAGGLGTVALWLGGQNGRRALMLAPLIWLSAPTLGTLQVGNAHLVVMTVAMLALVAFETRRPSLGGALLAFAILSKISPGVLGIVLLMRGRFREAAWTAGWAAIYVLLSVLAFGSAPLIDFVSYELPRLSSGEALSFLTGAESVAINLAPFGVPFKLAELGLFTGDPWSLAQRLSQLYTVVLVGATVLAARRDRGALATAQLWAALLTLASLRSPLAPGYAVFALLWLLSLRAGHVRRWSGVVATALAWLALALVPPLTGDPLLYHSLAQSVLLIGLSLYFLFWPSKAETSPG